MLSFLQELAGFALSPAAPRGFRLVRKLGAGGMGVVYEALDESLQRRVAIKRLRDDIAQSPGAKEQLLAEARTVAALRHPNIVEIYALLEHRGGLYLVFEYVDGLTLDQVMDPRRRLSPAEALHLLRQIASALDYAHARGIVHQDLKPSNIMVAGDAVKIMDFGIARRVEDLANAAEPKVRGTAAYMAPEAELGQGLKESDLYSLGVCLYEMLAGRGPFKNVASYFQKIERNYRPLTELSPALPGEIDRVLETVLSPFPLQRYPSAGAFLADLERVFATPA
ncbi:MAG: serine/threonine protein kinase [Elusimicrobia bacterium]|nr:serine/threonine protein kinase [Elusimicrobiota bacterium]